MDQVEDRLQRLESAVARLEGLISDDVRHAENRPRGPAKMEDADDARREEP